MSSPAPHETASWMGDNGEPAESVVFKRLVGEFPFAPVPGLSVQEGQSQGQLPRAEWRWGDTV